jgi:hypothetical protein
MLMSHPKQRDKALLPGLVAGFDATKHAACSQGIYRDRVTLDETYERLLQEVP